MAMCQPCQHMVSMWRNWTFPCNTGKREFKMLQPLWKTISSFFKKLKIYLPYNSEVNCCYADFIKKLSLATLRLREKIMLSIISINAYLPTLPTTHTTLNTFYMLLTSNLTAFPLNSKSVSPVLT